MITSVNRPLVLFTLSLTAGILFTSMLNSILLFFLSAMILGMICITIFGSCRNRVFIIAGVILCYSVGAFEHYFMTTSNNVKYKDFLGEQVTVEGVIDSQPDIKEAKISYIVRVLKVTTPERTEDAEGKILLNTLKSRESAIMDYGREVEITGSINMAKGKRNPGGFDYHRYLAQSGISATMFATPLNIKTGKLSGGNMLVSLGQRVRMGIVHTVNRLLPEQQAGLLNGMLIGYREGLDENVEDAFSDAGLTHIMAVSGANIAFIVFPLVFVYKKIRLGRKLANSIIICLLIIFVFITGFSPSVVRAVIMAVIILAGQIIDREGDIFTSIALAAFIMLIYNPYTLFDIGFQLSFAATLSLILFYPAIKNKLSTIKIPGIIADVLACTLAAQVGVLPITAFYFNKISTISILSNLVVVPTTQAITIGGFTMVFIGQFSMVLAQIIGYVNCTLLSFILYVTDISSKLPFAVLTIATPPLMAVILYYPAVIFFMWFKPKTEVKISQWKYAAVFGVLLFFTFINNIFPKGLEVVFIDVGQGDSALIRTYTGRTVLIDGGGHNVKTSTETNIGETVLIPFLLDYGVTRLDLVVATHGHDDHIQGLLPVLDNLNVEKLVIPRNQGRYEEFKALLSKAKIRNIPVAASSKGDLIKLDNKTSLKVFHPQKDIEASNSSLNNGSLVLKLDYVETSILFTGDIEEEVEKLLVETEADLQADLLKIAHHGSSTSTSTVFLDTVKPRAAVISVGKNNFGHPSPNVLDSLKQRNMQLFRTDESGALLLKSNGRKIKIVRTIR